MGFYCTKIIYLLKNNKKLGPLNGCYRQDTVYNII